MGAAWRTLRLAARLGSLAPKPSRTVVGTGSLRPASALWNKFGILRPPGFIEPCLPNVSRIVPTGPQWAFEIKHDGFRFICLRDGDRVRVFSRGEPVGVHHKFIWRSVGYNCRRRV